ncbi:MAG: NAD-dependent epimerase/dehydratase family protein [Deltaproteobacteria bacterium]|nr:NAD-dependent epimerase/dehydratase family protein [Deltaproteobacteria bacterium]
MVNRRPFVLVTGATGAIGPLVVGALLAAGYSIRTLSIDPPPAGAWPEGVETLGGDITEPSAVQRAMQGVESVVHLAALLHLMNPPDHLLDLYRKINVGGTQNVVESAIKEKVGRILLFSTISVYGDTQGRVVNEETLPRPDTFYARTKLEAENMVLAAKDRAGNPIGVVLRLAAVYGARVKGNYRQLFRALERGWFFPVGQGRNRRTLIYDKDAARAAVLALGHPAAAGRLYNVSDGRYHRLEEIIIAICRALGRTPPRFAIPAAPVRVAVGVVEDALKMIGLKPPVARATIDKYLEDVAVEGQLIQSELGFAPAFDLKAGWEDAVREMRRSGRGGQP